MDNKKYLGILFIAIGLLLLGGIVYIIFFYDFGPSGTNEETAIKEETKTVQTAVQEKPSIAQEEKIKTTPKKTVKREVGEYDLKMLAASFAERFGSFSNQADYGNITDLKVFMSGKMSEWADGYIKDEIDKRASNNIYYAIRTKAVAEVTQKFDNDLGEAEIMVNTRRRETTGAEGNNSDFSQDILVSFIKENGSWKVQGADWQAR